MLLLLLLLQLLLSLLLLLLMLLLLLLLLLWWGRRWKVGEEPLWELELLLFQERERRGAYCKFGTRIGREQEQEWERE
jgi:hypothetical protein